MRRIVLVGLACVAAIVALAQTRPSISQIKAPVVANGRLLAIVNGRLVMASLGAGVQLVQVGSAYELRATAQLASEAKLTRAADGSWAVPNGCTLQAVYRNGLRQLRTVDYSISGSSLRFTDGSGDPSEADDIVVVECH